MIRDPHAVIGPYLQADIRDEHAHDHGPRATPDAIDLALLADTWRRHSGKLAAHHRAHGDLRHANTYDANLFHTAIRQHLTADDHITIAELLILTTEAERAHYPRPHWF